MCPLSLWSRPSSSLPRPQEKVERRLRPRSPWVTLRFPPAPDRQRSVRFTLHCVHYPHTAPPLALSPETLTSIFTFTLLQFFLCLLQLDYGIVLLCILPLLVFLSPSPSVTSLLSMCRPKCSSSRQRTVHIGCRGPRGLSRLLKVIYRENGNQKRRHATPFRERRHL